MLRAQIKAVAISRDRPSVVSIELNVWARNPDAISFYRELGFETLRLELEKSIPRSN